VLRPAPGKDAALILDHVGNVTRHGFPDDPREWSLAEGIVRGGRGTPAPSVRTCPECYAAFKPAPICPVCGAGCVPIRSRVIREMAGELRELKREEVRQRTDERRQARTLQQLIAVGQARGMKNPVGWAKHVYFARQRA
jgi:hypothetical protein